MLLHAVIAVIQLSSHKGVVVITRWLCSLNTTFSKQHVCKSSGYLTEVQCSIAGFKLPRQPVNQCDICWSWKLVQEETKYHATVRLLLGAGKRGKSELLSLQSFLRSQTTVALISHPNCKFKNGGVRLTGSLIPCTTLSESFRRLARLQCSSAAFEASKSQGRRFAFFQCLVSREDLKTMQSGLMISIKDQWVLLNLWPKLELCIEWASNDVRSKKISCCPREYGWVPDENTTMMR